MNPQDIAHLDPLEVEAIVAESRWASTCANEVAWLMEGAREGVPQFVDLELRPLGKNLLRAVNVTLAARDLYRIANHLGEIFLGPRPSTPLILASEEHLARAFSRWCVGPESLNLFLAETFSFLYDALERRHGAERTEARVREAIERFAPVRLEVLRRLTVGPRAVRVLSGPTAHMAVPALWAASSVTIGQRRADEALRGQDLAERVRRSLGVEVQPEGAMPEPVKIAFVGLAMIVGASAAATVGYRMLPMEQQYTDLLDEVEYLLLDGFIEKDDEQEVFGPGLLEIVARLDLDLPFE